MDGGPKAIVVVNCGSEPHRIEVDGGRLRFLDHNESDRSGVCPDAGGAWSRGAWVEEMPAPLVQVARERWAGIGVKDRSDLEMVRETVGDLTPEQLSRVVATLGGAPRALWWDLQRWARVMRRKLTGLDIEALAAVKDRVRPCEAALWQVACGHLPGSDELDGFVGLGVTSGGDAWDWARALGRTIDPATVEHLRSMGFRGSSDLYGWGQLLGTPPGGQPGPDEIERIRSLRRAGIRRPRHAALWAGRSAGPRPPQMCGRIRSSG